MRVILSKMKAVILAGGKGMRLRPYTHIIPKPLMPIGDKAILEIILDQLLSAGFEEIHLAVGYQADYIKTFLNGKLKYNNKIKFSHEKEPLSTAGPIKLVENYVNEDFLVINGDTLTDLSYSDFIKFHKDSGNIGTVAVYKKSVNIDLGVLKLDEYNNIKDYIEKPIYEHFVSTGIYAFKPEVFKYIDEGEKIGFPDLVKRLIGRGEKLSTYQINGTWMDLGRPQDYEEATDFYEKNKAVFM